MRPSRVATASRRASFPSVHRRSVSWHECSSPPWNSVVRSRILSSADAWAAAMARLAASAWSSRRASAVASTRASVCALRSAACWLLPDTASWISKRSWPAVSVILRQASCRHRSKRSSSCRARRASDSAASSRSCRSCLSACSLTPLKDAAASLAASWSPAANLRSAAPRLWLSSASALLSSANWPQSSWQRASRRRVSEPSSAPSSSSRRTAASARE
mmetsp:Transcript_48647/g.150544  ORF Transcript_48647/g.150544 Transcript_48647/m.150544 type:complete len:219 (-) Transcript_48647:77-733(-)